MSNKIAFLGCGSMNEAIMAGLLAAGTDPADVVATVRRAERAAELAHKHSVVAVAGEENPENNKEAATGASDEDGHGDVHPVAPVVCREFPRSSC